MRRQPAIKKAKDILLLNMENISPVTDYFIIASAGNNILVKAIADNIEDKIGGGRHFLLLTKKAMRKAAGFLMDYGNCVCAYLLLKKSASSIIWKSLVRCQSDSDCRPRLMTDLT
mgnify:CR=1 FL=1